MRDVIEERLAARLRDLGEVTPAELSPPADLRARVGRRKHRTRAITRGLVLGIAAAMIVAFTSVVVLQGSTGRPRVDVSSRLPAPTVHDALPEGTVLLAARGRDVVALDDGGHTLATMIHAGRGAIQYAQVTADHRWLWYLSRKGTDGTCADVVRADIDGRSSKIITRASAFAISPDGARLALFGAGDLANNRCVTKPTAAQPTRVVVEQLDGGQSAALAATNVTALRWSPDGAYLVTVRCSGARCLSLERMDVPRDLRLSLVRNHGFAEVPAGQSFVTFGVDGLYVLQSSPSGQAVDRYDPGTLEFAGVRVATDRHWSVSQVAPTAGATFVVATRAPGRPGLYVVGADGRLHLVRPIDPGILTPVFPLPAAG